MLTRRHHTSVMLLVLTCMAFPCFGADGLPDHAPAPQNASARTVDNNTRVFVSAVSTLSDYVLVPSGDATSTPTQRIRPLAESAGRKYFERVLDDPQAFVSRPPALSEYTPTAAFDGKFDRMQTPRGDRQRPSLERRPAFVTSISSLDDYVPDAESTMTLGSVLREEAEDARARAENVLRERSVFTSPPPTLNEYAPAPGAIHDTRQRTEPAARQSAD